MRQLIPAPAAPDEPDLGACYAYPPDRARWVRANMVASVDGAAQTDGLSGGLSGPADKKVFHVLRALADVILVGAGTARSEGYGQAEPVPEGFARLRADAGQAPVAAIAVVSAGLGLDFGSPLFSDAEVPTIIVTVADAPPDRLEAARAAGEVLTAGIGRVNLALALDALAARGLGRILCEGGPRLLGALASGGLLDELCLSVSPRMEAGDALRILAGARLSAPAGLALDGLLTEDGFLFARYLVTS